MAKSLCISGGRWIIDCEGLVKLAIENNADVRIENTQFLQELFLDESVLWCKNPILTLRTLFAHTNSNRSTEFESRLRKLFPILMSHETVLDTLILKFTGDSLKPILSDLKNQNEDNDVWSEI